MGCQEIAMEVSMTRVAMTFVLLLISTATSGLPLQDQARARLETLLDEGLSRRAGETAAEAYTLHQQNVTSEDKQQSGKNATRQLTENISEGSTPIASVPERFLKTESIVTAKSQIPKRIRRTSHCRRQTDDELMELLKTTGGVNTRYADQSHHGFRSLVSYTTNEELDRLTKLEIEAALRANHSEDKSLQQSHLHVIRSSLVTPEEANVPRTKRSVVGTTVSNFCVTSRQETTQGYMRMCDSCAATTELSSDLFPRYINEVVCSSNTDCLSGAGRCSERMLNITILRRTQHCSVAATSGASGQIMYVEEWEPTVQRIRVACECDINVQSVFASYV